MNFDEIARMMTLLNTGNNNGNIQNIMEILGGQNKTTDNVDNNLSSVDNNIMNLMTMLGKNNQQNNVHNENLHNKVYNLYRENK